MKGVGMHGVEGWGISKIGVPKSLLIIGLLGVSSWPEGQDESELDPVARTAPAPGAPVPTGEGVANASAALANTAAQVNEFTGQASFSVPLAAIANHGGIGFSINLQYLGGGVGDKDAQQQEFASTSWVGAGFSMRSPFIIGDNKGTADIGDDEYSLAMDGMSPVGLVPEAGNPNILVPKSNPHVRVQRYTAAISDAQYSEPSPPVSNTFSHEVVRYWEITLPDGSRQRFGADLPCDDLTNPVICVPVTGGRFGYFPYFSYNAGAKTPFLWHLKQITSRDNRFSIFFEYQRIQEAVTGIVYGGGASSPILNADRAIYLSRVFSVNGASEAATRLEQVDFTLENKPSGEYVSAPKSPLALVESKRLRSVEYLHTGTLVRKLAFQYGTTGNSKTRLERITEQEGALLTVRQLQKFDYFPDKPWLIAKVTGRNGTSFTYQFSDYEYPAPGAVRPPPQVINLKSVPMGDSSENLLSGFEFPKVTYRGEIKGKYYVLVEDSGLGALVKPKLFEFEPRNIYWKLNRVFISPFNGHKFNPSNKNDFAFSMGPTGDYFVFTNGADIRMYDAQFEGFASLSVDLGGTLPAGFQLGAFANTHVTPSDRPVNRIMPFRDWMAIYTIPDIESNLVNQSTWKATLYFYFKTSTGWRSVANVPGDVGGPSGCSRMVPFATINAGLERITGCLVWERPSGAFGFPEVKPGNDFVTLVYRHWAGGPTANGSVVRIFSLDRDLGKMKSYTGGLGSSWAQKGGAPPNAESWFRWYNGVQRTGNFDVEVYDVSVYGDLIGLLVHEWNGNEINYPGVMYAVDVLNHNWDAMPTRLFVFSWDGGQLRFLYNKDNLSSARSNRHALYMGPDYFLYRGSDPADFARGAISFFKIDRKAWSVTPSATPVMTGVPSSDQWVPKLFQDYFSLEKLTGPTDRPGRIFEPARVNPNPASNFYPIANSKLFKVDGTAFQEVTGFGTPGAVSIGLGNFIMGGDRYLAVENYEPQPGTTATRYVHGRVNQNGLWKEAIPFPFNETSEDPFHFSLSSSLLSTGLSGFEYGGRTFTGKVLFQGRFDSEVMKRVSQVDSRTKGDASLASEGTLSSVTFSGASSFNAISLVPNFISSAKTHLASGKKAATTFNFDSESAPLDISDIGKHGLPARMKETTGQFSRQDQGEAEVLNTYKTASIAASTDGNPLKEPVKVVRMVRSTVRSFRNQKYFSIDTRFTDFNPRNGAAQVTITKRGREYNMDVAVFDNTATVSRTLVRQTASYLFRDMTEPCTGIGEDFCSNIGIPWFLEPPTTPPDPHFRPTRAIRSMVTQYDTDGEVQTAFFWRPAALGESGLYSLDGSTTPPSGHTEVTAGRWIRGVDVLGRASGQASNLSKHAQPVSLKDRGISSTMFYGGPEGYLLASARNASKTVCTYLGGEEANLGTKWGAFGDWEVVGSVSTEVAHTGAHSLKTTSEYGPTVNIHFRQDSDFWARKKGLQVSGWIFVPGLANGNPAQDPGPAAIVEFRTSPLVPPVSSANLIAEYVQAKGPLPYNRWVKLERLITWEELNAIGYDPGDPASDPVLRIWFGKNPNPGNQSTLPVYVDDLRVHPSDASMTSQGFNSQGLPSGSLDVHNNPVYPVYDVWGNILGAKNEKGLLFTTSAFKMVGE